MTENEIKKILYKDNSPAAFIYFRKGFRHYQTILPITGTKIHFEVPISDTGDADFERDMPAKLLIRYLTTQ